MIRAKGVTEERLRASGMAYTIIQADADMDLLVAIGPSGLVRSRDGGVTWEPMAYPGAPVATLAAADDESALYAATSVGLRRSTDEGLVYFGRWRAPMRDPG